jgi:hypothetical protein
MNLKMILGSMMGLMVSVSFAKVDIKDIGNNRVYDFSVDSLQLKKKIIENSSFSEVTLNGVNGFTGVHYQVGSPEIPVIRFTTPAENKTDIIVSSIQIKNINTVQLNQELKPSFDSVEKVIGAKFKLVKNKFYQTSTYPNLEYKIEEIGSIRGQKQFMVTLYPVVFNGIKNQIEIRRDFRVEVKKVEVSKVGNSSAILFVIGDKFKNNSELQKYMELKTTLQGLKVLSLVVKNGMTADALRAKIQKIYKENPDLKYAIMIGEAEDVPSRESTIIAGLTDHYYAAIDTQDYETDINAPELYVGRISATSNTELDGILRKYTRYMSGDFASTNWLNNISFLATDDNYEVAEGTHNHVIDTYTKSLGFLGHFPNRTQAGGDKLYAIAHSAGNEETMNAFTKGRAIIDYSGHGALTYWDAPRMEQDHVRSLKHTSLPFVISNSCITGDFREPESFGETWQRHEWGAITFWGSMDSTFWEEDDILEKRMFDGIFKDNLREFGAITHNALSEFWLHYGGEGKSAYYWETYVLFGDPSISLRLK